MTSMPPDGTTPESRPTYTLSPRANSRQTSRNKAGHRYYSPQTELANGNSTKDNDPSDLTNRDSEELMAQQEQMRQYMEDQKKLRWAVWVNNEFNKCKNARIPFENQWYINLAFLSGKHYIAPLDVPGAGFRLISPRAPAWRVRLVINKVRTAHRTECSKLCSSRPIPTVMPATSEDEDFAAANVAEQLVKNKFAEADFNRTYRSWVWWGSACGTSFLKSYWNPSAPDPNLSFPAKPVIGMNGQPLKRHDGSTVYEPEEFVRGKIEVERITPFHIYVPDLLAEDLNKQPYIIHATTRSPLWVERTFGFKPTCDTRAADTIMKSAFLVAKNTEQVLDSVIIKEVWLKPDAHPDFPEGGMLTVINDKVVQYQHSWPWPFPEYPFYKYDAIPTGGFYADSILVDLIPLNKEYNRTRSQMVEIKNTMGKPKLVYPKGSINPRQINSEPGQSIPYTPGYDKPTVLNGTDVPTSMYNELEVLGNDFDDISGQHDITRGQTPANVSSGTAISFLQEQDDQKLNFQVSSIEYAMEMLGKHYLKYVSRYWSVPRLVRIAGANDSFEAKEFIGSELRGNTDVKIQTGSALPISKAARQAMISEFMQYGWLDPVTGMEILELGAFNKAIDELLVDKKQAQRENLRMAEMDEQYLQMWFNDLRNKDPEGNPIRPPIPVNSYDDNEQHIHWHNQYRKTQQYENLPEMVKQAFELHVQMHHMATMMPLTGLGGQQFTSQMDPNALQTQQSMDQHGIQMAQGQQQLDQGQQKMEQGQQQIEQQGTKGSLANVLTVSQIEANRARSALDQKQASE